MILRISAAALVSLIALNGPALASASVFCDIKDKNVEFTFGGAIGTITGGGMQVNRGHLTVQARDNWPTLTLKVTRGHGANASEHTLQLGQQWLYDRELRLWFFESEYYRVDLILQMKLKNADDGENYSGTYEFSQSGEDESERKHSGQVSCWIGY